MRRFKPGDPIPTAADLNAFSNSMKRRITGGKDVNVRAFSNKLFFEKMKKHKRRIRELGIPVYDRNWYSENIITIHRSPIPDVEGLTYDEAKKELQIEKILQ